MPYSDNMYSMDDDSPGEDYSDQISPSDGQFPSSSSNITPHIPNVLIPDPTLQRETEREAESKALEAEEDRLLSSRTDPAYRHWESSSRSPNGLEQATTETTASIPRHQHQITHSQSSAAQSSTRALPSRGWLPTVYPEAPPAYSPSPIPPVPSGNVTTQQDRPRNYNTFSNSRIMGAPEVESERLLGSGPESMGAPVDEERGTSPVWARRVRGRLPKWLSWKYALLALAVLIVSIAFLSGITSSSRPSKGDDTNTGPALPIDKEPDTQIPDDDDIEHPGDSESPHNPGSPGSPGSSFESPYCEGQQHRYDDQILSLDFKRSQNLTFRERGYKNSGSMSVRVGGQIDVRKLYKKDKDPRMVLEIATNDPFLRLYTSLDADLQEIKVNIPETFESTVPGQRPCVEIRGTVWVPEGGELSVLSLRAIHLGISLLDDLSLKVADYTELASVAGDIKAAVGRSGSNGKDLGSLHFNPDHLFIPAKNTWAFNSRVTEVHTTSGNIKGNWPLYDMLGLHSTSGNQEVSITPHGELETDPKSAILSLSTVSGSISATEPVHELSHIPRREYLVDVKSTSGNVYGAFAFSGGITVHTTASDLSLDLLPVINVDKWTAQNPAQLETVTTSGEIAVRVLEPAFFDDEGKALALDGNNDAMTSRTLDCLEANHKSTSGSIGLRYPQSWEGLLYAQTTSGRLVAKGKDLKIVKYTGGWPGSKMEARKGDVGKKSTIEVHALLGGMDAVIGDE